MIRLGIKYDVITIIWFCRNISDCIIMGITTFVFSAISKPLMRAKLLPTTIYFVL